MNSLYAVFYMKVQIKSVSVSNSFITVFCLSVLDAGANSKFRNFHMNMVFTFFLLDGIRLRWKSLIFILKSEIEISFKYYLEDKTFIKTLKILHINNQDFLNFLLLFQFFSCFFFVFSLSASFSIFVFYLLLLFSLRHLPTVCVL